MRSSHWIRSIKTSTAIFIVSLGMHAVNLVVTHLGNDHSTFFQLRKPFNLFHQISQLSILVNLNSVADNRSDDIGTRSFHYCDVENGIRVMRQGDSQSVEIFKCISFLMTLLALDIGALLTDKKI